MWPRRKRWSLMGGGRSYLASDRVTPKYDIHIGQHGKPRLDILKLAPSGPSGHHPGFESGYQGGISKAIPSPTVEGAEEVTIEGGNAGLDAYPNKIPTIMARQASQTPTAPFGGGIGKSAYQGVGSKKKGNKLKYIVEALRELEGETPDALAGRDRVGGTRPGMSGYTPTDMGAYVDNPVATQAALAEARRKKEKEGLMNLLYGGYV